MNCILIDKSILNFIGRNTNKIQKYKSVTEWGIYQFEDDSILLEPFDFSKMVLKKLINFSNEYLNILGYKRYLDEVKDVNPQDLYVLSIEAFKNGKLGL
jgi:cell shape-determining protein MreC